MAKVVKRQDLTFGNQEMIDAMNFGQAFQMARLKAGGAGGVFTWKGKKYTTDFATEDWSPTYPGKRKGSGQSATSTSSPSNKVASDGSVLDESVEDVMPDLDEGHETEDVEVNEGDYDDYVPTSTPGENRINVTVPNPTNYPGITDKVVGVAAGLGAGWAVKNLLRPRPDPISSVYESRNSINKSTVPPSTKFVLVGEPYEGARAYDPNAEADRILRENSKVAIRQTPDFVSSSSPISNVTDVEWTDVPRRTLPQGGISSQLGAGSRLLPSGEALRLGPGSIPPINIVPGGETPIALGKGRVSRARKPRVRRGK